MKGNDIRREFLEYFQNQSHRVVRSGSLLPPDDTLLFTNAGMNQFKDVFLGSESRDYSRAATSQKCVRAGGKHNDLENVGHTARHHTFFEMLGNFSFGDYFKQDAIHFAWDLLINRYGLDPKRLAITVYLDDDEAAEIWAKETGFGEDKIQRLGKKDNFWEMGETGPCGPCSEIHFHQSEDLPCALEEEGKACEGIPCDCDRWMEIWNLVFMQFEKAPDGTMTPLPKPSIDTGMGLERIASVMQGVASNFETDLVFPIIEAVAGDAGVEYTQDQATKVALQVIADHLRASVFMIGDGILPGNEGRGYVLRKIIRRALRYGRKIGLDGVLSRHAKVVQELYGEAYPELTEEAHFNAIVAMLAVEEKLFNNTLSGSLSKLQELVESIQKDGGKAIPGAELFRLYDTFGLPMDLAKDAADDAGLSLDMDGFEAAMAEQREKARASWKGSIDTEQLKTYQEALQQGANVFTGHAPELWGGNTEGHGKVVALFNAEGQPVDHLKQGDQGSLALDSTPFYAESGGQVGDQGQISSDSGLAKVSNTSSPVKGLILHHVQVLEGEFKPSDQVEAHVDAHARRETACNHTATHILHAALKKVLGQHVKQAGSLVNPQHLRFDFTHFQGLDQDTLAEIEAMVNQEVRKATALTTKVQSLDEAIADGAVALFGEKYEDKVRVVSVGEFSTELCGGTHLDNTARIGAFKILEEKSVSQGVRRIEAVTGEAALAEFARDYSLLRSLEGQLNVKSGQLLEELSRLQGKLKDQEKEVSRLRLKLAQGGSSSEDEAQSVAGISFLARQADGLSDEELRQLADSLRHKLGSGVVVLARGVEDKATVLVAVTADLKGKLHAGNLVKELGKMVGGGGGGRPDLAMAGGKNPAGIPAALEEVPKLLEKALQD